MSEYRQKWLRHMRQPDDSCVFFVGYRGYCETGGYPYCDDHNGAECWECGHQATKKCATQNCEVIECREHPHYQTHK